MTPDFIPLQVLATDMEVHTSMVERMKKIAENFDRILVSQGQVELVAALFYSSISILVSGPLHLSFLFSSEAFFNFR